MDELKKHLAQCKKVTVREYVSQSTGEIRLYVQFHFIRGAKELSFQSTDEVNQLIDDYLTGKPIQN